MSLDTLRKVPRNRRGGRSACLHPRRPNSCMCHYFLVARHISKCTDQVVSSNKFRCPTCSKSFKDFGSAVEQHGTCISWSCRFLCSVSSSFHTCGYTSLKCRLCGEAFPFGNPDPSGLWEHAKTHTLGHCDQDMFTSKEQFLQHLCAVHSARES